MSVAIASAPLFAAESSAEGENYGDIIDAARMLYDGSSTNKSWRHTT